MANAPIAALIAARLGSGLPHPGRPEHDEGPRLLPMVAFRTESMPPEMAEHARNTAQAVGEAVVHLVETEGQSVIIERGELDKLRAADQGPGVPLPVVCMGCGNPIMYLKVVNGRALVHQDMFRQVNADCPHIHNMEAAP